MVFHKELAIGMLRKLIRYSGLSVDEFLVLPNRQVDSLAGFLSADCLIFAAIVAYYRGAE
ncbi:MAG: hypothetical protein EA384_07860 [Spirochaetaceae bacterium]|nr:MAG: hypothetical protein EA384_07860 [Spirochaetaceae bacterium]